MSEPARSISIRGSTAIPAGELCFDFVHAAGPGGQHVNKASTAVTLSFSLAESPSLSATEKRQIRAVLGNRVGKDGVLRLTARTHRSQARNREEAVERFQTLLARALTPVKKRRPTRPTKASRAARLVKKKHRGAVKERRRRAEAEE